MKLVRLALLAGLMVAIALSGCQTDDDDPITPTPANSLYTKNIKDAPVYLNLETGDSASVWDIAFMRSASGQLPSFRVNGGISGSKGYTVAQLAAAMTLTNHDTTGWTWRSDVNDSTYGIGDTWASYNPITHAITGYDSVSYVLQFDAYKWVKLHVINYGAGTVRFNYAYSDSVSGGRVYWRTAMSDSISGAVAGTLKYYRFGFGEVTSNTWQFAMVTSWYNTGSGGIGNVMFPYGRLNKTAGVEASWVNATFDNVTSVPTGTMWHTDSDTLYTGWLFNYNSSTHAMPAWDKTLLVKQSSHIWKLSFDSYMNDQGTRGFITYRKSMIQ
ncbi:MAG: hypothetical protein OEM52_12615 [bacterium]|nr:hypothetical protein [bacterium]